MDNTERILNHPALLSCISHRIPVMIQDERILIQGFYKADYAELVIENDKLIAKTRYDNNTEIKTFQDLAELNYYWWKISRTRNQGWRFPTSYWTPVLRDFELITIVVEEVTIIKENQ